ncbi:MAG TPA: sporulation protein YtfJ [Clostridia bacterium]|jgi:sporulation protein YtfJ|nr:sporulation protein YtfJ [Clostridia bacterium]
MNEHPIQGLMKTAMESIKDMIDVNTIVGDAVETQDGSVIIPVSKVGFGFAAGGGNTPTPEKSDKAEGENTMPFAGGSGAGVSISPVGFLVVGQGNIKMLPVNNTILYDRILDLIPQVIEQIQKAMFHKGQKNEQGEVKID